MKIIKTFEGGLKDLDATTGQVTFYFSAFNNLDSDNDITLPGAFLKTIIENKERIRHFKNHDSRLAPGVIKELGEDTFGAWARSQLIMGTMLGKETFEEYKAGAIKEHSFGFDYVKYSDVKDPKDPWSRVRTVTEYKLWEVSSLNSWGANERTQVIDLKNQKQADEYLDILLKLKKGQFTDEYLQNIELKISECLKYLQTLKTTTQIEPGDKPFDAITYLKTNLKILN
jgi:HK97 family phage prohead protease